MSAAVASPLASNAALDVARVARGFPDPDA